MNAFTSYTNTMKHVDMTKLGVSLLIRDSFCQADDGWWVAGYATTVSTLGCECHPILVKPSSEGHTLYVRTTLKGLASDSLWEELGKLCPEYHNILRA